MNSLKLSLLMFLVGSSLSASNDKDVHEVMNYPSAYAFVHAVAVEARAEDEVVAKAKAKQADLDKDVEKAEVAYNEARAKQADRDKGQLFPLECEIVNEARRELQRTIKAAGQDDSYSKDSSSDSDSGPDYDIDRNYVSQKEMEHERNEAKAKAERKFNNSWSFYN